MKKIIALSFIAIVLEFAFHKAIAQQFDSTKEREALKSVITNYENAWNRHDAKGLADNYDSNATWVNWFGAYYKGKQDIQEHYETVHTTYFKPSHLYTRSIEDIIFINSDVAIMHVRTGLTGDARFSGQTFEFRRTLLLTKRDNTWHILAGQNAKFGEGVK